MKILTLTVNKNDSTSFYRANGVLGDLRKQMNLEIISMDFKQLNDMSWANLSLVDVVFMQRPYLNAAVQMAEYCKTFNKPVWVDYDDYLLDIPIDNQRAFNVFSEKNVKENIIKIIRLASVISVSTPDLKEALKAFNSNIKVIPNAINLDLFKYRRQQTPKNTVIWRGSDTHQLDIFVHAEQIYSITQKYSEYTFSYFGFYPWFIPMEKNTQYIKPTDPILYFQHLYKLAPRIMHVPLIDSVFNRCKSNIAYIEGTFAGAICLVPDWEEWNLPGTVPYSNPDDFKEKFELLLNNKINIEKRVKKAWEYISTHLSLSVINKKRIDLLKEITK